jgi:intracellular multiplication protein IcmG
VNNDPVNKSNEEEYQFVDSENSAGFSSSSPKRPSMPVKDSAAGGGQKKVFIAIGILVAAFCLYKLYGVFSATPEKPKSEMPVVAMEPVKVSPVVVAKPPEPTVSQEVSTVQDKVGSLEKIVSQVSQSNANLQDQMAGVSTAIADIQNSVSSLSQQITALTAKPKENPVEAKKAEEKKAAKSKVKSKAKNVISKGTAKKTASYYVKAMIQGRAWLMTSEGETLTVSEGDMLPGYGLINSINPKDGTITTSSGTVIGYRADDK